MKITKLILFFIFLNLTLLSCQTLQEAGRELRNEKRTTDEFLVKKNEPLTRPPNMDVIPEPGSSDKMNKDETDLSKIFNLPDEENQTKKSKSSSVELSIIEKIRK
tara:strand:- start:1356 stop:1670 length:315 start_codon:yes stop_codon:yes gene_type:complete